jgi:outer membrane protein assembly factor BamB
MSAAMSPRLLLALAVLAGVLPEAHAAPGQAGAEWPQWLGPKRNGVAVDPGVFSGKSQVRLEKAWSRPLEAGQAGVAVAGGRLFTLFRDGSDDYALALRADAGQEAWRVKLDPGVESPWLSGPASTPAFHDGRVFTLSSACLLRGHDAETGRVLWEVDFKQRFGTAYQIGCASSPFVEAGRLYVVTGGPKEHRAGAFDPKTGAVLWTSKGGEPAATNSSPAAAELAGVRQLLFNHNVGFQRSGVTALRLEDGALLWSVTPGQGFSFDMPLGLAPDRVWFQTANALHVLKVAREGEQWRSEPLWRSEELQAGISSALLHGGHLFGYGGDHLACVDLETGRTAWKEKTYPGSLILVDGHLIALSTSAGLLRVAEATASGYREKARLQLLNKGAQAQAPASYAGRRIYVRNEDEVAAVDVR